MTSIKQVRSIVDSPTYVVVSNGFLSTSQVGVTPRDSLYAYDGSLVGITATSIPTAIAELAITPVTGWFNTTGTSNIDLLTHNNKLRKLTITGNTTFTGSGYGLGRKTMVMLRELNVGQRTLTFPPSWVFANGADMSTIYNERILLTILCTSANDSECIVFVNEID